MHLCPHTCDFLLSNNCATVSKVRCCDLLSLSPSSIRGLLFVHAAVSFWWLLILSLVPMFYPFPELSTTLLKTKYENETALWEFQAGKKASVGDFMNLA